QLAQAALGYGGRVVWSRAGGDQRLLPLLEEAVPLLRDDDGGLPMGRLAPLLEEALRLLGNEDVDLRVRLLARLSGALRDEPSRERRDELSREAIELARRSGNPASLAYALGARGHAIAAPDTTEELLSLGTELCETARALGDRERVTAGHAVRTLALLIRGEVRAAEREAAAFNRLAAEIKQVPQLWDAASTAALLAL